MRRPLPRDYGLTAADIARGEKMERERPGVFTDLRFHTKEEVFGYLSGEDKLMCYEFAVRAFEKKIRR